MQLGLGFWGSKTLLSAIELSLFTELAKGPLDANAVCDRLKLHPRVRLLDALVALRMLEREPTEIPQRAGTDLFSITRNRVTPADLEMANARLSVLGRDPKVCARATSERSQSGGDPFKAICRSERTREFS